MPSDCSDFTAVRGTRTSSAVLPSNRIERVSSADAESARVPSSFEVRTRTWSSARVPTLESSSLGSTPRRRTVRLAALLRNRMTSPKISP